MSIYLSDCQFQQLKAAVEAKAEAVAVAALNALKENFICRYRAVI